MWLLAQAVVLQMTMSVIRITCRSDELESTYISAEANNERKALTQFRSMVKDIVEFDYENTDEFLLGWLHENEMDINMADQMLRKVKRWRKDNQVDTILNETIEEIITNSFNCSLDTFDKDGDPVVICEISSLDARKLLLNGHKRRLLRFCIQWAEKSLLLAREINKKRGKFIKDPLLIVDMKGFNLKRHTCVACIQACHEFIRIALQYYPRVVTHLVFINLPRIGLPFARIITPALKEYHQKVLKIFGTDKEVYSEFLLRFIPSNQLAVEYGGTRIKHITSN